MTQRITFSGAGGHMLAAGLEMPNAGEPLGYALFAHCFTCSKDSRAAYRVSQALGAKGIAVLRFDFTGLGDSEGDFANTDFSSNVADIVAAIAFMRQELRAPAILIGHSLGGTAVLAAAADAPECRAVAVIGAPAQPEHVKRLFSTTDLAQITEQGTAEVTLAGRRFTVKREFLEDLTTTNLYRRIRNMRKALLVMHSPTDTTVDIDNARQIFDTALHPKSFISLDSADHLLLRTEDATYVADVLTAWASRYISQQDMVGASTADSPITPQAAPADDDAVVVTEVTPLGFKQQVRRGPHLLLADEPASVGGDDAGLNPYEFLLAALGTCTAMTLRLYARRKNLPLEGVEVVLRHNKVHAQDCTDCETISGYIDQIEREVRLFGDLNETQQNSLMAIADKCPVHRTLHSKVSVVTSRGNVSK